MPAKTIRLATAKEERGGTAPAETFLVQFQLERTHTMATNYLE